MFKIVFSISQKYIVFVLKATTGDCFLGGKNYFFITRTIWNKYTWQWEYDIQFLNAKIHGTYVSSRGLSTYQHSARCTRHIDGTLHESSPTCIRWTWRPPLSTIFTRTSLVQVRLCWFVLLISTATSYLCHHRHMAAINSVWIRFLVGITVSTIARNKFTSRSSSHTA